MEAKPLTDMKILGIDYGKAKIGLAIGESSLAEPWKVVNVESFDDAVKKAKSAFAEASVDKVVVGISEGEIGEESKKFAEEISAETFDETLTSQDAQRLSREAGVGQKKRYEMEDAYAAAIMLQNYLDSVYR
jgi:RNase H-fold protein (predicted Holliday junction resolvase)